MRQLPMIIAAVAAQFTPDLPNIPGWTEGAVFFTNLQCRGITDCEKCLEKGCSFCDGGSVLKSVFTLGNILGPQVTAMFTEEEKSDARLCGFAAEKCDELITWYNHLPSLAQGAIQAAVPAYKSPAYNPCGPEQDSACAQILGLGAAAAVIMI